MTMAVMMMGDNPNIMWFLQIIETKTILYLVLELVEGQQFYKYIQKYGYLKQDKSGKHIANISSDEPTALGTPYFTGTWNQIVFILNINGKNKIIEFRLSIRVEPGQMLKHHCGAYTSVAPELLFVNVYDGQPSSLSLNHSKPQI